MDIHVVITFILTFTVVSVVGAERHRDRVDISSSGGYPEWDRLLLVLQWSPTACSTFGKDCIKSKVKNNWTIHGLWPNQGFLPEPVNCNNSWHFDPKQIQDLRKVMDQKWGTLNKTLTNYKFWAYEWQKHGTCVAQLASIHTQHDYFSRTLQLSSDIDLYGMLNRANIRPSETILYPYASVLSAIHEGLGHAVGMYCTDDYNSLLEVRICYDLSFNLIDCKEMYGEQCDPKLKIKIPPKL